MSIISNAKELADLVQKLGDAELYRRIVELEGEIVDLSRENVLPNTAAIAVTRAVAMRRYFITASVL